MIAVPRFAMLLPLIMAGWCVLGGVGSTAKAELLFYMAFDESINADYARGSNRDAEDSARVDHLLAPAGLAKWGRALAPDPETPLRFPAADNLDLRQGTIECFVRFDDFGDEWREHRLFSAGAHPFDGVFSFSVHPQGEHLIATWRFNDTSEWFHAANYLKAGQWHHVAVTWQRGAGDPEQVELAIYIDGQRRARATNALPYDTQPEIFAIGSDPTGHRAVDGQIDDFAVFGTVRYRESFTPPAEPASARVAIPSHTIRQPQADLVIDEAQNMSATTVVGHTPRIVNASFTEWEDGKPLGWDVRHGSYERDANMNIRDGASLRMTPDREQPDQWLNTQISQRVTLEPNAAYHLRFWMAKDGPSRVFVRIRPVIDGQADAQHAVLDWNNGWTRHFAWTQIELNFHAAEHEAYELSIVQYGQPDQPAWIDDVQLVPADPTGLPELTVNDADRERGFQLYTQSVMRRFDQRAQPTLAQRAGRLHLAGTPGEYVPGLVAIHALADLDEIDVAVSAALTGPGEQRIEADAVVIREVRDEVLPLTSPRSASQGRSLAWWLTVHVNDELAAGTYRGEVAVTRAGETVATLPLEVEVEPFTLPAADIPMGVYHNERYFPEGYLSAEQRMAYYRDMRDHGMNTVTVYNNPDVDGESVDFNRNQVYAPGVMDIEALNQRGYMLTEQEVADRHEWGLNQVMNMVMEAGFGETGMPVFWLAHKPGQYNWGGVPRNSLQTIVDTWLAHPDWPTPLLYVNDEPAGHPDRIADARKTLDQIAEMNLPVQTITAEVSIDELGADYDIWLQLERNFRPEIAQAARDHEAELWVYNCNVATENGPFTRSLFGFWAYRSGVKGVMLWAYYDGMNWRMDEQGQVLGRNGQFGFSRIVPSPDGPVPTISWETTREGVDDYRYALLFDQLSERASDESERLKAEALEVLGEQVIEQIEQREQMLIRKKEADESLPTWQAASEAEQRAAEAYLLGRTLEREARVARQVRQQVIMSIPYDTMALHASLPFIDATREHYPQISLGDPATAAEDKRQVLRSYIRRLHHTLASLDEVGQLSTAAASE